MTRMPVVETARLLIRPFAMEDLTVSPAHQRRGYATEAAQALVDYAVQTLRLKRVIATTDYDNVASVGVMSKLGMRIENNPLPDPPWLQVVGVLEQV